MNFAPHIPDSSAPPDVLVVDDHADTRVLMQRLLKLDGYSSAAVDSAGAALTYLAASMPRLIITDFNMPGMDGLQLLIALRADERFQRMPVIMFSAMSGNIRELSLSRGANAFIPKSTLDWAQIRVEVIRLIGAGTLPAAAATRPQRQDLETR